MREVIAEDWGSDPERVLAEIDPEPAAAASIGQVYRGRTAEGREVAVKVQYPGIAETVESDMRNLRLLTPLLRQLMPGLEIKEVLAELASGSSRSATTSSRRATTGGSPASGAGTLSSASPASTPSSAAGGSWSPSGWTASGSRRSPSEPDPVRDRYVEIVYRFFYGTVRELGLALGDPHPGNYLLCPDGRVAFFDFGMLRRLPPGYLPTRERSPPRSARRRRDPAARDARARLPSRRGLRLGRPAAPRLHARGLLVAEVR